MNIDVHCNKCKYDGTTNLDLDIFSLKQRHDFTLGHCQYFWNVEKGHSYLCCMGCGSSDVRSKKLDDVMIKRGVYGQIDLNISV